MSRKILSGSSFGWRVLAGVVIFAAKPETTSLKASPKLTFGSASKK